MPGRFNPGLLPGEHGPSKGTLLGDGEVSHYGSTPLPQRGRSLGTGTIFACFLGVASCLGEAEASSEEVCQKGLGTLSLAWLALMELALDLHMWLNSMVTGATSLLADGISACQAFEACPLSKRFEGKTLHDAVPMVTVLMMMGILYFVFFLCCLRTNPACDLSTQMCCLFHASFLMALVSYHQAVVTDPGRVPESWREGPGTKERLACMIFERKKSTGDMRFCSKEMKYKPDRSHFCSNMQRNVLRMDHYCPWMGNCIGFANYKYFLLFLLYTVICTDSVFGLAMTAIWAGAMVPGTAAFVLESLALSGLLGLCLSPFLVFHLWMLCKNMTTIEFCEQLGRGQYISPYDLGAFANIQSVLGRNMLFWLLPIYSTPGDGLRWQRSCRNFVEPAKKAASMQRP